MSEDNDKFSLPVHPLETLRRIGRETAEQWRSRLAMLRGALIKNPVEQLGRIASVVRFLDTYRQVDRALFYHRYATALMLAHNLGVFDRLRDRALTVEQLAGRCEMEVSAARTLVRILESQNLVRREGDRVEATGFTRHFLRRDSPVSLTTLVDIGTAYAESFNDMLEAAKTGERPPRLDIFDERGRDDALLDGVNSYIDQAARELIARVDWPEIRHLIVGSMGVSFSALMLETFDDARVTYGCLPHLVERIPRLRREYGVDPTRVVDTHAHGGEPFDDQWGRESFDLVFLTKKMILDPANDLGDKFARKTHQVLEPGGVAVFWETIHEDDEATPLRRAMESLLDFGVSPTAPVLTRKQFAQRLRDIGFRDIQVVSCLNDTTTFVIARRPGG